MRSFWSIYQLFPTEYRFHSKNKKYTCTLSLNIQFIGTRLRNEKLSKVSQYYQEKQWRKKKECNKMNCELMLTYDTPALRQTGSRNLTGQKTLSTIWGTYMKLVTKYQISAINSCWEKRDEKCAYMFNVYKNQLSRQTGSGNLTGPKTLPTIWYTYSIWRLWPNIWFLPSTVTEKNATKNILDRQR